MTEPQVVVTIKLMRRQHEALRRHRLRTGETVSSLIRRLVDAWLVRQVVLPSDHPAEQAAEAVAAGRR